jgi:hypothetical protein
MKRLPFPSPILIAGLVVIIAAATTVAVPLFKQSQEGHLIKETASGQQYVSGYVAAEFKPGITKQAAEAILSSYGLKPDHTSWTNLANAGRLCTVLGERTKESDPEKILQAIGDGGIFEQEDAYNPWPPGTMPAPGKVAFDTGVRVLFPYGKNQDGLDAFAAAHPQLRITCDNEEAMTLTYGNIPVQDGTEQEWAARLRKDYRVTAAQLKFIPQGRDY